MKLNSAYVHISVNHTPILASLFATGFLAYGWWKKNRHSENAGHALFIVGALSTLPTALSGIGARNIVRPLPTVRDDKIHRHIWSAVTSTVLLSVQAALSARSIKDENASASSRSLLLPALINTAMFVAAHYGGEIRHSETRSDGDYERELAGR
jgi:hypothetical protein